MEYVFAKNLNKFVPHGSFSQDETGKIFFKRVVDWSSVRWSDHAFCINTDIFLKSWWKKTKYIKIILNTETQGMHIYKIDKKEALKIGKQVENEYGEINLRIPIEFFSLKIK